MDPDLRGEVEQSILVEMTTLVDAFRRDTAEYIETVTDEKNRRAEQRSDVLNLPQHVRRVLERRVQILDVGTAALGEVRRAAATTA
ncbi:hypothetical protein, partial [Natrinema soli]|uniref:hypothetical protein n=1 Tax=Natrinema soli TaxID=1930624 RepID=UPI002360412F